METVGVARRRGVVPVLLKFPLRLQMYAAAPTLELSIEDFEAYAIDRLQVLRAVEAAKARNKKDEELATAIKTAEDLYMPLHRNNSGGVTTANLDDERRKDVISHFILRLAFCRTEDLRRWFLGQECALFKYRFESESSQDVAQFLEHNHLGFEPIAEEERTRLLPQLLAGSPHVKAKGAELFYKVPFEEALELVQGRRVYVHDGFAYVPATDVITLVMGVFRARLSAALTHTAKVLPSMEEDDRLLPILQNMSQINVGADYKARVADGITADAVDSLVDHFPLCMRHLHESLRAEGHLKHGGRNQYGLFLKGLGLSMPEALVFWRRAFQQRIPEDKFAKSYAYNIRYNYGQEGKRTDFSPYSCMKIIMNNPPSAGDHHGCPFRHFNPENLRAKLRTLGVSDSHQTEILDLVKNSHFQIACTRLYEVTHKLDTQLPPFTQPNAYADMSMGRTGGSGAGAATTSPARGSASQAAAMASGEASGTAASGSTPMEL